MGRDALGGEGLEDLAVGQRAQMSGGAARDAGRIPHHDPGRVGDGVIHDVDAEPLDGHARAAAGQAHVEDGGQSRRLQRGSHALARCFVLDGQDQAANDVAAHRRAIEELRHLLGRVGGVAGERLEPRDQDVALPRAGWHGPILVTRRIAVNGRAALDPSDRPWLDRPCDAGRGTRGNRR